MTTGRDYRVTLALKWHYLDGLTAGEIRDRFSEQQIADITASTVRDYLNEQPREEVLEQIEEEQAKVRLQVTNRAERRWRRARKAEAAATQDKSINRVVPATARVPDDAPPKEVPGWEFVDAEDDRPEWATERDTIIWFTGGTTTVQSGEEYPVQSFDGSPKYTTEFVGLQRDQPDQDARSRRRREQAEHMQQKGKVAGVFADPLELEGSIETESEVSVNDETKAILRSTLAQKYGVEDDDDNE